MISNKNFIKKRSKPEYTRNVLWGQYNLDTKIQRSGFRYLLSWLKFILIYLLDKAPKI